MGCINTPWERLIVLIMVVSGVIPLAGCAGGPGLTRHKFMRPAMGGEATIVVYCETWDEAAEAARAAFDRIKVLNDVMSDYQDDSELMRLCAQSGSGPHAASDDLINVLGRAEEISRASDGAFDVTVGPIVRLWRSMREVERLPTTDELAASMEVVGWEKVQLDRAARTVDLTAEGMRLDLGGIGKGFAADEAFEEMVRRGLTRCLINMGGDIRLGDPPPGEEGWRVVPVPFADGKRGEPMMLANVGVASSGDSERFLELDGVRYSHIVDPRTGTGLTSRTAVTVIAQDATAADALASALSVLGPESGRDLAVKFGAQVEFQRKAADNN